VHQFEAGGVASERPQRFDDTGADAAATVHRHAGGLIDNEYAFVLVEQRLIQARL
jgi:hypothetical protein